MDNGANLLIPVPGGGDGPGGVLVAADNFIIYKDQDHAEARLWWIILILRLFPRPLCQ